jgi:hypothetical protein
MEVHGALRTPKKVTLNKINEILRCERLFKSDLAVAIAHK